MGLVTCVDCKRPVSDRLAACPHCGGPVDRTADAPDTAAHAPRPQRRWLHALLLPIAGFALTPLLGYQQLPDWPGALGITTSFLALPLLAGWGFLLRGPKAAWSTFALLLVLVAAPTAYKGAAALLRPTHAADGALQLPAPGAPIANRVVAPEKVDATGARGSILDAVLEQPESDGATAGADEQPQSAQAEQALRDLRRIMDDGVAENRRAIGELDQEFSQIPLRDVLQAQSLTSPDGIERGRMAIRDMRMHVQRRITVTRELQAGLDRQIRAKIPTTAEWDAFWTDYRASYAKRSSQIDKIAGNQRALIASANSIIEFMAARPGQAYAEGSKLVFADPDVEALYNERARQLQIVLGEEQRLYREEQDARQAGLQAFDELPAQ